MIDIPSPVAESSVLGNNVKVEPEVVEVDTVTTSQASRVSVKAESPPGGDNKNKRQRVHSH